MSDHRSSHMVHPDRPGHIQAFHQVQLIQTFNCETVLFHYFNSTLCWERGLASNQTSCTQRSSQNPNTASCDLLLVFYAVWSSWTRSSMFTPWMNSARSFPWSTCRSPSVCCSKYSDHQGSLLSRLNARRMMSCTVMEPKPLQFHLLHCWMFNSILINISWACRWNCVYTLVNNTSYFHASTICISISVNICISIPIILNLVSCFITMLPN